MKKLKRRLKNQKIQTAAGKLATITDGGRVDAIKKSIDEGGKSDDIAQLGVARNDMVRIQNELDEIECTVTWPSILLKYNEECKEVEKTTTTMW